VGWRPGQLDLLEQAGCRRIFSEKISTRVRVHPELENALGLAREIKPATRNRSRVPGVQPSARHTTRSASRPRSSTADSP
jgi:hypothetical protein